MRKIIYSNVSKAIAVVLFITGIILGVLAVVNGFSKYGEEKEFIYSFESDFSQSKVISHLLDGPESVIFNGYHSVFPLYDDTGKAILPENIDKAWKREKLESSIRQWYDNDTSHNLHKINYFIQWNELSMTNCSASNAEEVLVGEYYAYLKKADGAIEREYSISKNNGSAPLLEWINDYDPESNIIIACNIKEETISEYKSIWEKQKGIVVGTVLQCLSCLIGVLLSFIYLIAVCGKTKDGERTTMWLDNVWIEVHLAVIAGSALGMVDLIRYMFMKYGSNHLNSNFICWGLSVGLAIASMIILPSVLSVVRNIKNRMLTKTSIILRVIKWSFRVIKKGLRWFGKTSKVFWKAIFRLLSKKTGVMLISMLFVYTAIIGGFGVCMVISPIWLVWGVLLFGLAAFVVASRAGDFDEIKEGVSQVRNGNVAYKIPELKCEDLRKLAVNINNIAKGLDESVSAKVKAERLKTELITNVSHDIKTPITSIISYTELLANVEGLPEEARDYVAVIAKKSNRLKNLTQDLFDISKVQSGNDDVVLEKLDVSLLIGQALGEHDNEIHNSGLEFCVDTPKELYISADGRKMSRVLSNLIHNILKYTMKNTRVFIAASEKDELVQVKLKNISAYPLNFKGEEITGRFVRGDESRTTEGNGLGLAIAKSYTEICNGIFEVVVDGDMFKVIIKFKKYA